MQQKSFDLIKTGLFLIEVWSKQTPTLFNLENVKYEFNCIEKEILLRNGLNRLYYGVLNCLAFHFDQAIEKGIHRWFVGKVKDQTNYNNKKEYLTIHKKLLNLQKLREWSDYNLDSNISMVYGTEIQEKTLKHHLHKVLRWLVSKNIIPSLFN